MWNNRQQFIKHIVQQTRYCPPAYFAGTPWRYTAPGELVTEGPGGESGVNACEQDEGTVLYEIERLANAVLDAMPEEPYPLRVMQVPNPLHTLSAGSWQARRAFPRRSIAYRQTRARCEGAPTATVPRWLSA